MSSWKCCIHLTIYDKRSEIAKKYSPSTAVKYDKTIEHIGDAWYNSNRSITRVEFTIGRAVLKEFGINSLEDFRMREAGLCKWLTHDWFRLLKNPKVRGTENDAEIHPLWERVQSLFFQHFTCEAVPEVKREKPAIVSIDAGRLHLQGIGCMIGESAVSHGKQESVEDLRRVLHKAINRTIDEQALEKHNRRVELVEIEKGVKIRKENEAMEQAAEQATEWFATGPDAEVATPPPLLAEPGTLTND